MISDPPEKRVKVESQDTAPPRYNLTLTVELIEPIANNSHPAGLRVLATNQANMEQSLRANNLPPLPSNKSEQQNPGLILIPSGQPSIDPHPVPIAQGCWQLAEPVGEVLTHDTGNIGPKERRKRDFTIWGDLNNEESCLPSGSFRFEGRYDEPEIEDESPLEWGFTIRVSEV